MKIITEYQENLITFEVKYDEQDLAIKDNDLSKQLHKWSKMLSDSLTIINHRLYPLYTKDNSIFYIFGYSKELKDIEFNITCYGFIQNQYNNFKNKHKENK